MNMKDLRNLLASARKQGLKFEQTTPDGTGAYDFHFSGDLELEVDGCTITISDIWCGGSVEGECYRKHISCDDFQCRLSRLDAVSQKLVDLIPVKSDRETAEELQVS